MAIYTRFGSEVDIVKVHHSRKGDETIVHSVDLRRKDGSMLCRCRLCDLKADGGVREIDDAIAALLDREPAKTGG